MGLLSASASAISATKVRAGASFSCGLWSAPSIAPTLNVYDSIQLSLISGPLPISQWILPPSPFHRASFLPAVDEILPTLDSQNFSLGYLFSSVLQTSSYSSVK